MKILDLKANPRENVMWKFQSKKISNCSESFVQNCYVAKKNFGPLEVKPEATTKWLDKDFCDL